MIAMAIVLASIFAIVLVVRRYVPAARAGSGGSMKVVARTYLSPKQSVALLQVGRRHVIVGITPDRLTNLGHIEDVQESFDLRVQTAASALDTARQGSAPRSEEASFDKLLEHQAAEYAEPELPADVTAPVDPGRMRETLGRMQDLLARLRSIQEEVR
jgi:flagellar biosynthetic protein FliO